MAFTNESKALELYGVDLAGDDNVSRIQDQYFGPNTFNLKDPVSVKNNGANTPLTDHMHVGLTGEVQKYRFWLKEFNFERNQKFENLMAHCKNMSLLERRKFLFFDEEITDVVIPQIYEIRVLVPRNLFGFDSISQCTVGYFDEVSKEITSFTSEGSVIFFLGEI
jgi:hypothetical protein